MIYSTFAFGRVRQFVDFLQLRDAHMCIYLRAFQAGVAEHSLNEADVRTVFQHQRGHAVAEDMTASGQPDVGLADVTAHAVAQMLRQHRFTVFGQEQAFAAERTDQ